MNKFRLITSLIESNLRYLGIGFAWAWTYCSYNTSALHPDRMGNGIGSTPSWIVAASFVSVAFIVSGFVFRRSGLLKHRWARIAAPLLLVLGTLLSAVSQSGMFYQAALLIGGALCGTGYAWLCIMWAESLVDLEIEKVEFILPAASIITMVCSFLFPSLGGAVGLIGVVLLPLLSGAMLSSAYAGNKELRSTSEDRQESVKVTSKMIVSVFLLLVTSYCVIGAVDVVGSIIGTALASSQFDVPVFVGSGCGVVLAICIVFYSIKIDFPSMYRWLTPFLIAALCLISWNNVFTNTISKAIVSGADACLQLVVFLYCINLAKKHALPIVLGIGLTQGFVQLGVLAGDISGFAFIHSFASQPQGIHVFASILICLLSFACIALPGTLGKPEATTEEFGGTSEERAALRIAQERNLTGRETEILVYLSKGRSQPYIREELVLSKSTVATHVKHIYQKLDIHSKQELIDLIETERRR